MTSTETHRSMRATLALDILTFLLGPLRGGAGSYGAFYFASSRHWSAAEIGLFLGVMAVSLGIAQVPVGILIDKVSNRNFAVSAALLALAFSWTLMLFCPSLALVICAQVVVGTACAIFTPAVAAISLELSESNLDGRLSRNEMLYHAGNVATGIFVGFATYLNNANSVLTLLIVTALGAAFATTFLSKRKQAAALRQISDDKKEKGSGIAAGLLTLLGSRTKIAFLIACLFYTFANASMLPLMVQMISKESVRNAALQLPAALMLAELIMVPVCFVAGKIAHRGRKPLLIASFVTLVLRGFGLTLIGCGPGLISMQVLDGISSGLFSYTACLVVADLSRRSGRFSSTLSALAMMSTLTNGFSEYTSGLIAAHQGMPFALAFLTLVAAGGLATVLTSVRETVGDSPERGGRERPRIFPHGFRLWPALPGPFKLARILAVNARK